MLDVKIDIEQALKDLADYEKSVENRVVQEISVTGQAVRNDAVKFAPIITGFLRGGIQVGQIVNYTLFVNAFTEYSKYVEFGTSRSKAQPFMNPAAESNRADHLRRIKKAVKG